MELKPCPCGETPTQLGVSEGSTFRWIYVEGNCCGWWQMEVRSVGYGATNEENMAAAIEGWNKAPRHGEVE